MGYSRLSQIEEKRARFRLVAAIFGIIGVIVFLFTFGLKILIGFSLGLDRLRGTSPETNTSSQFIAAPTIDQLPTATNSALLFVSGLAGSGNSVLLYLNDEQIKNTMANEAGYYRFTNITLKEGQNSLLTKAVSGIGNTSASSNLQIVKFKKSTPLLEIIEPIDNNLTLSNESNLITLKGNTEERNTLTVNGRFVVISPNGNFEYQYPLSEGDNQLTFIVQDEFGNSKTLERSIKYQKP